jgi:hypothetical protein
LATERLASWLRRVGGEASKQMTESRQHPFCNFVSILQLGRADPTAFAGFPPLRTLSRRYGRSDKPNLHPFRR